MINDQLKHKIADGLEIAHLTQLEQDKIILSLAHIVSVRVATEVDKKLSAEDHKTLRETQLSDDEILEFLNSRIGDLSRIVEQITRDTVSDFKNKRASISKNTRASM